MPDLQYIFSSLVLLQADLECGKLEPGLGQVGELLTVFLVQHAHSVDLAQLLLDCDVGFEHLLLREETQRATEYFPGFGEIAAPEAELRVVDPHLAEGELLMGDQFDGPLVDLLGLL